MSDDISEDDNKIHRLETEYFHANDRLASRATSLKFHADHSNVSIIANWEVFKNWSHVVHLESTCQFRFGKQDPKSLLIVLILFSTARRYLSNAYIPLLSITYILIINKKKSDINYI